MAERKADIVVGAGSASGKLEFSQLNREERRARRAQVLERGVVGDRLHVELPAGYYGEWVHNSPEEVYRMQNLGFIVDTEYAHKRALHSGGDSTAQVGDVIFMVCDAEAKQDIDEFKRRKFEEIHGKPGVKRSAAEEREFASSVKTGTTLSVIESSSETPVSGADILNSIQQDVQT